MGPHFKMVCYKRCQTNMYGFLPAAHGFHFLIESWKLLCFTCRGSQDHQNTRMLRSDSKAHDKGNSSNFGL